MTSDLRAAAVAARERADELRLRAQITFARAEVVIARAQASAARAGAMDRLAHELTHLRRAMESRATIEQAVGIIIGETGKEPEAAFQLLVRLSQRSNRKLRAVAADLVASKVADAR